MTRDEIIELAREAGMDAFTTTPAVNAIGKSVPIAWLQRFADLVAAQLLERTGQYLTNDATREAAIADAVAAEREACAKVCDELHWPWHMGDNSGPKECAKAIRARGDRP